MESFSGSLLSIIAFLLMLGVLVLVHELGHFLTARSLGIRVEEFGIGFPPRAATLFERDGVRYTLNWLPIGGFVRFGGEGESVYGVGSLSSAPPWKKISVLLAGPLMNLVLAILIFSLLFLFRGAPVQLDGAEVREVYPNTPAAAAQIQTGDIIRSVNGQPVGKDLLVISQIAQQHKGETLDVVVERNGQQQNLRVTPGPWATTDGEQHESGFGFAYTTRVTMEPVSVPRAFVTGFSYTWEVLGQFIQGLGQLVGSLFGLNQAPPGGVTGIVGIARGTNEVIRQSGLDGFLRWSALISLNLFLVNLLPIPALDGSHILFSLIEFVRRGKKIPPEKEAMVHAIGFAALMGLMVLITVSDISHWISGGSVLGN